MKLYQRFIFFFGGFAVGIVILFFFLSGKKTSCDYGPNARVLKNIRVKERIISNEIITMLQTNALDTAAISEVLKNGDVLFDESQKELKPCQLYIIAGKVQSAKIEKELKISIKNCDTLAIIEHIEIVSN